MQQDFEDHYETLEVSPNANLETIERVFRYFATKHHPDAGGDQLRFKKFLRAFETLKDPEARAAYDAEYQQRQQHEQNLMDHAVAAGDDTVDRHKLLCIFYAKRRQNPAKPALGIHTIERAMKCPAEVLEFHIWYFREKGWIQREENGGLSITSAGVDRIESDKVAAANHNLLEWKRKSASTVQLPHAASA